MVAVTDRVVVKDMVTVNDLSVGEIIKVTHKDGGYISDALVTRANLGLSEKHSLVVITRDETDVIVRFFPAREDSFPTGDGPGGEELHLYDRSVWYCPENDEYNDLYDAFGYATKTQRTLVMVKPDGMIIPGVQKEIINAYLDAGLEIVAARRIIPSRDLLAVQYTHHEGKPFLPSLLDYMRGEGEEFHNYVRDVLDREYETLGKYQGNLAMILEGVDAIEVVRRINGPTDPDEARAISPDSIRGRFAGKYNDCIYNIVHASDSPAGAERETQFYFPNFKKDSVTLDAMLLGSPS